MDIFEAISKRRSIRGYSEKEIEEDKLEKVLEAARLAPSASNRQEWRFVVVKDAKVRKRLSEAAKSQMFVAQAPVVIAACAQTDNHEMTCGQKCYPIDVAIAIEHMVLVATAQGLGTCWIGAFFEDEVRKILNIPDEIRVVELLCIGYPKEELGPAKERLPLESIVKKEKWS